MQHGKDEIYLILGKFFYSFEYADDSVLGLTIEPILQEFVDGNVSVHFSFSCNGFISNVEKPFISDLS